MTLDPSTVALVTGASSGIGATIAARLIERGARVILLARRGDRLRDLADRLGPRALPAVADVADPSALARAIAGLPDEFASITCLVNNAGLALGLGAAQAADMNHWRTMIAANCEGLAAVTHAVLPGMIARGVGDIINLGSVAGAYPYPGANVYGATKAFVHQFSLALRSDVHGTGVRVTCLEPGMVAETEFSEVRFGGDAARAAAVYDGVEALRPDDLADAVEWLLSLPRRVNVNVLEIMPTAQSFGGFQFVRAPFSPGARS